MFDNILRKALLPLILISIMASPVISYSDAVQNEPNDDSSVGFFALGAGIIGGLGLAALFSSKSDTQIIEGSSGALADARGYNEQIEILDNAFNLTKLLKDSKAKHRVATLDEEINYDLASTGISIDQHYINDLKKLTDDLEFYQNKLPKRIKKLNYKLKRKKDCESILEMISKMEESLKSINRILPKLIFLKDYIKARAGYFEFYNIIILTSEIYSGEINNLEKYTEDKLGSQLTRSARAKYSESSLYPCIDYVKSIENDIYKIQNQLKKLPNAYQDLHEDAQDLEDYLIKIKQAVISDPEYLQEKRDLYNQEHPKTFLGLTYVIS